MIHNENWQLVNAIGLEIGQIIWVNNRLKVLDFCVGYDLYGDCYLLIKVLNLNDPKDIFSLIVRENDTQIMRLS